MIKKFRNKNSSSRLISLAVVVSVFTAMIITGIALNY